MTRRRNAPVFDARERFKELRQTRKEVKAGKYNPSQMRALSSMFASENRLLAESLVANRMAGVKLDKKKIRLQNVTM
jgi:hypothetical protein